MMPIFSVVICTFNRGELLEKALESLIGQSLDKSRFEIVVIDDGSTDNTEMIVNSFKQKYSRFSINYHKNHNSGLAASRNIAVKLSRAEYMAYLDDDAYAHTDWLKEAYSCILSVKPTPNAVTGPIYSYYQTKKPAWFDDSYVDDVKGIKGCFLDKNETLSGPNMIIRKNLIKKCGGFDESVDMKADIIMLGEETSLFERLWRDFPEIKFYYCPDVIVYHLTHPYKMEVKYLLKRWFASGQSYFLRNKSEKLYSKLKRAIKVCGYFLFSVITLIPYYFRYKYFQNWVVERIGPVLFSIGFVYPMLGITKYMRNDRRT